VSQREHEDKEGFVELYDRLHRRLLAYLARRVPDAEVAAELWAESWAVAFENWRRRRSQDPAASEAWMFGIARNHLAAYYRSRSIEQRALRRLGWTVPPVDAGLEEELDRVFDRDGVGTDFARGMQALSSVRQRAVRLRILEGREYSYIAASLGCSEQTARAHVSRGLRRLAKALDRQKPTASELTAP
jgi:RNA polymerase sigma factor (sigma-70 family)